MADATGWKITGQATGQVINTQSGRTPTGTIVYFITNDGNEGSVFIEDNHYSKETVHRAIREWATRLDDVGRLADNYTGT